MTYVMMVDFQKNELKEKTRSCLANGAERNKANGLKEVLKINKMSKESWYASGKLEDIIRIDISEDFIVDYDKARGMYRVSVFDDGHFWDEFWFDAYEEKEVNEEYIKLLRRNIAEEVEDKMQYMHECPNAKDAYLHIIAPHDYPLVKQSHCNTDCYNENCASYHNGINNKENAKPIKRFEKPMTREDAWWCGYCPRCETILDYNYRGNSEEGKRKQYCWNCGQLVDFELNP